MDKTEENDVKEIPTREGGNRFQKRLERNRLGCQGYGLGDVGKRGRLRSSLALYHLIEPSFEVSIWARSLDAP
jgi:hypothetical protein